MRALFRFAFGCLLAFQVAPAWAGVYADDLSRCLVGKSTDADKIVLMKWFFSALEQFAIILQHSRHDGCSFGIRLV